MTRAAARRTADWTPGRAAPRCLFHHEGLRPRARKNRGEPSADDGHPPRAQPGRSRTARPRQATEADPGTAGRPAIQADPAAVTGARTAPLPIRARPQARLRPDTRRPPLVARATRQPTKGRATRQLPRARATRQQPSGTGYPGATPGTGYPPATRGTGSGRAAGRRRREHSEGREPSRGAAQPASAPATTGGPPSRENAWRRPERRPGQEIQGAPGNGSGSGGSQPRGSLWSAGAFRTAGPGGRGPLRGFPPAPGAPDPVYPPGQFSPWNAPELRAISAAGRSGLTAGSGPETSEPGYPLLAVSDPSADATATQTWAVLDDAQLAVLDDAQLAGEWTAAPSGAPARSGRDESGRLGDRRWPPDRATGILRVGRRSRGTGRICGSGTYGAPTHGTRTHGGARSTGRNRRTVGLRGPAGVRAPGQPRVPRRGWFSR